MTRTGQWDETEGARDKGRPCVNVVMNRTPDSESIEGISDVEELEDDVFLGYFTVDSDGKKRPIPAPRRLVRTSAANKEEAASVGVTKGSSEGNKSGKEVELVEVRGIRISLSTDSQGRDLSFIPPGSDGFSPLIKSSTLNEFRMQEMVDEGNTLPQQSKAEEAWNQAGPGFRQNQTRFRTYGNTFDAGVVLTEFTGPRPFCAHKHTTTNINKPPEINVTNVNNDIPLSTVAHATVDLTDGPVSSSGSGFQVIERDSPASRAGSQNGEPHPFTLLTNIIFILHASD